MKIITTSKVGYNHPTQANWSYGIYKIDTIDTSNTYCMSYIVKETFGGNDRFTSRWNNKEITNVPVIETKEIYPLPKITGVAKMLDIESEEFNKEIASFINNK